MLDDKYRIDRLLAVGGMGAVYVGTHIKLRKRVAIKVLNPQLSSAPMIERFHREAVTASQIGHEGIAQVTDIGTSGDGEPFLVMEYLEGEPLAARLHMSGPLTVEDACEIGCAILSPLSAAHRAGIVHRDLKPDNVFLVRQSRGEIVKLLDFGISRTTGTDASFRLTNTGLVLGTPYYMSPEQARGESEITPAADLYAFGVILYEMLVGDVPIRAENYNQLMYRVTMGDFERPRDRRPDLPERLEQIIIHTMAQLPAERPASAAELEQALLPFCRPAFREHGSGRISAPGISLARSSSADLDPQRFAGPTVSDTHPDDLFRSPADTDYIPVPSAIFEPGELGEHDEHDEHASQPALPVFANPGDVPTAFPTAVLRRSRTPRILAGLALVTVVAAATGWLVIALTGHPSPPASPPVAVRPPVASKPPATQSASPANTGGTTASAAVAGDQPARPQATITLRLAVQPPGAAITLDGAPVNGTELTVAKDAAPHQLRIVAAGYVAYNETISFDENQRLVVKLERTGRPPRDRTAPRDEHTILPKTDPDNRIESKSPYE
jgi:serine/threonine-protein kinase